MGGILPKAMRRAGMDGVISSGTDRRPARNLAGVTLVIENAKPTAPAMFSL